MAVLFHDEVARHVAPRAPVADAFLRRVLDFPVRHAALDEVALHHQQLSQLARAQNLFRRVVFGAIVVLKTKDDVLGFVRLLRGGEQPFHAGHVRSGGLLDVDVLARFHRRFEVLRVQEHRGGDQHRVDGRVRQQLAVVLVHPRLIGAGDRGLGLVDRLAHDIAERHDSRAPVFREQAEVEAPPPARADNPESDRRVRLRPRLSSRNPLPRRPALPAC